MEAGHELILRARRICGQAHVITDPSLLSVYRSDGQRRDGPLPLAVILPGSAAEVAGVVSACTALAIRYVVRGAGTSRDGSSLPHSGEVLVVTTRMRQVLALRGTELTVQTGAPLAGALPGGPRAWLGTDELLGTVGGYVARSASLTNLCAIELVGTDGRLMLLDARQPGYDLVGAFPGSRGRCGIAVTLTLRRLSQR
ncbi:MAG: FAD-binding oxidoreductase [Actinomycetota bacterium]|nr:FAD-binding oxidoreductase [Actinomycetota bacterium]